MTIPRGDDEPDHPIGLCIICEDVIVNTQEYTEVGLGREIHDGCERRKADRRGEDRRGALAVPRPECPECGSTGRHESDCQQILVREE
jgi:hypothetical protein